MHGNAATQGPAPKTHLASHHNSVNVFSDIQPRDTYNTEFMGKWRVAEEFI